MTAASGGRGAGAEGGSIDALIKSLNDAQFQQPDVPSEAQAELRKRGWFECYSCTNWYADEWHYREGCCLGCGDPCDGTWDGSAPVGWWTDPAVRTAHRDRQ